jgi:Cys-tRNA(Pro)/Cys-tRNA(Cys) deacylase
MGKKDKNKGKELGKTNAARLLDAAGVAYTLHETGTGDEFHSGVEVAQIVGADPATMFKTLVTAGVSGEHYVCVIPVAEELDLKKAAKHFGEKKIEMIHAKDILAVTGYMKGGCSPIGMKKPFPTAIDASAEPQKKIYFSAGRRGQQLCMDPKDLGKVVDFDFADLCVKMPL